METTTFAETDSQTNPNFGIISFVLFLILGMLFYLTWEENGIFYQLEKTVISHGELMEEYGLQVGKVQLSPNAKTIIFHLEVVDRAKANRLLADPDITIGIWVIETGTHIMFNENIAEEDLKLGDGLVLSLSNLGGIVQPGMDVYAVLGNLFVEPITVE